MFRKAFSFGVMLLLVGAAVLVTPGSGQAQHHGGGGHGGGFHSGGGHGGGFNHGGFNHGGFNHGGFNHAYPHYGSRGYYGYHYPRNYGYYGAWPSYYGAYPYVWSAPAYGSGSYSSYGDVTPSYPDGYTVVTPPAGSYQAYYPPATVATDTAPGQPDNAAQVTISAPADAEIWFNDTKTTSTGAVREYQSPALAPGTRYTYELRARWNENGHEVTQTQQVEVTAGTRVNVHFPVRPTKAPTVSSH